MCTCGGYFWKKKKPTKKCMFNFLPACAVVISQRKAVQLSLQLSTQTLPAWENSTWMATSCRILEWRCCLLWRRVQTINWTNLCEFIILTMLENDSCIKLLPACTADSLMSSFVIHVINPLFCLFFMSCLAVGSTCSPRLFQDGLINKLKKREKP